MIKRASIFQRLVRRLGFVFAASMGIMLGSVLLLTVFYYIVEGDQGQGRGWFDWLYFTVITTRTIGFGDITPQTVLGKLGTIFNALLPASLFFGASLVVLQEFFTWMEQAYRRYRMETLRGHHIVVADEELMESIVQEYAHMDHPFVCVLDRKREELAPALQDLLDDTNYYMGDPTRDEVLTAVNIEKAEAVLIATADDNVNLYVLVTARGLKPGVKTIVRVNRTETESKFRSVGANILLPAGTMLGRMVTRAAVSPYAQDLLVRLQTGTADPTLEEVAVSAAQVGQPVREVIRNAVAIARGGQYYFRLQEQTLQAEDVVLRIRD